MGETGLVEFGGREPGAEALCPGRGEVRLRAEDGELDSTQVDRCALGPVGDLGATFLLGTVQTSFLGLQKKMPETRWLHTTKTYFFLQFWGSHVSLRLGIRGVRPFPPLPASGLWLRRSNLCPVFTWAPPCASASLL